MSIRPLIAFVVCGAAAHAAPLPALIDRPVTLRAGALDLTLQGTYTNWSASDSVLGVRSSLAGETVALGADFGASDAAQFGLALALPVHPGAGFGSILGSAAFAASKSVALRIDAGFENYGFNGDTAGIRGTTHVNRFFGGLGPRIKAPLSPTVAFVMGRTGTVQFGHFNNLGDQGLGLYSGASLLTEGASDLLVISSGNNGGTSTLTDVGVNVPLGLLLQPDPRFALTLLAGYSAVIVIPSTGSSEVLHFVPVGVEAVVTPSAPIDVGLRFFFDGYVGTTGGTSSNQGYFDTRALMLWVTVHGG
ncbi:MAG TPA: hypothetical protein VI356_01140 [Myxococcales bacterium]